MSTLRSALTTCLLGASVALAFSAPTTLHAQPLCAPGTWSPTGRQPCTPAPAGYYVLTKGATSPTIAPPGTYVPAAGAVKPTPARAGFFVPLPGSTVRFPAELGFYSSGERPIAEVPAAPGYFVPTTMATHQTLCAAQTTSYGQAPACRFIGGAGTPVPGSVEPEFASSFTPGSTIDLGLLAQGSTFTLHWWIANTSTALQSIYGGMPSAPQVLELTQLSLLGVTASPAPQVLTTILGLPAGTVLGEGGLEPFDVAITGVARGAFTQTLSFHTDATAGFGQPGATYDVQFTGTVTPEPSSLSLVALGALGLGAAVVRRRRRA
ncbi:PEP motif putative anchor domain protein [Gemmatirosa kalamazoonensis]|uniref:PEP motif putative anchor domain protein n=1 Tax=Gemmatirosa kalamazoonensis TaxID=861299 RepID=W0REP6_9BACT|nr:PEP-CTERM sorting domain-containing protein [Gemmatirosa kalamazoonensis]AHG89251.1 PEP motif putative anchor domain protein [Gemmatirosa kalamazoonensis]